ncbi:cytidine deaminase [Gallaecimonas xiamenensis]|uniref:Cytidine deaminase n=1 Tax=Gallaecimonas xiamenensis 3-C-1 TaxID=745411 RepID=K2J790_9GAMM|nr:cytidine deaminase [Gallaecimonas xiamenensis]EKE70963.1 cytidine deaminase [Gallaecimonas xiamenensis 3-C-1]
MNNTLLAASLPLLPSALQQPATDWLATRPFAARLAPEQVQHWCALSGLDKDQLMLALLPLARCFAHASISDFYVGAIVEGQSGIWYFGANQEFAGATLGMTIHAEQCAINHARQQGEQQLVTLAVNYSPCGYCRQFMSEISQDLSLRVLLPGRPALTLADYLPDAFGPWDLDKEERLLAPRQHSLATTSTDPLHQAAAKAASQSHAPYTGTLAGVALQMGSQVVTGTYLENAAYNPSLPPLQGALIQAAMAGIPWQASRLVLAQRQGKVDLKESTAQLAKALGLPAPQVLPL